jgi:pimeloyl-ACP methyl ester carboxylesterase
MTIKIVLLSILCLFILLIAVIVGITVFNQMFFFAYLFADYSIKSIYKPKEYAHASFWLYVKNFWIELFYVLGKIYYLPFKHINLTVKGAENATTAILLVHGYCRNQTDWIWMRKQFKQTKCPVFTVNLNPMFGGIDEITRNSLPQKIQEIITKTKCKQIILIGHSMGGLVSSYYNAYMDQDKLIKAVVMIGSPVYGTKVSVFGKGKNAQQMCPGSSFQTELHAELHKIPFNHYQICSKFDNLIFPWQSALFEHTPTSRQLVLPFASHLGLIHKKQVAEQLNVWIKELI